MRKHLLTVLASAALAFGIAGQASAHDRHGDRHHNHGHHKHYKHKHHHHDHYRPYYSGAYYGPARPYYRGYYAPPPPPPPYYGYGVTYSQPGFGIYIGR